MQNSSATGKREASTPDSAPGTSLVYLDHPRYGPWFRWEGAFLFFCATGVSLIFIDLVKRLKLTTGVAAVDVGLPFVVGTSRVVSVAAVAVGVDKAYSQWLSRASRGPKRRVRTSTGDRVVLARMLLGVIVAGVRVAKTMEAQETARRVGLETSRVAYEERLDAWRASDEGREYAKAKAQNRKLRTLGARLLDDGRRLSHPKKRSDGAALLRAADAIDIGKLGSTTMASFVFRPSSARYASSVSRSSHRRASSAPEASCPTTGRKVNGTSRSRIFGTNIKGGQVRVGLQHGPRDRSADQGFGLESQRRYLRQLRHRRRGYQHVRRSAATRVPVCFFNGIPPILGQQLTLTSTTSRAQMERLALLVQRAQVTHPVPECDLIAKAVVGDRWRGWLMLDDGRFMSDAGHESPLSLAALIDLTSSGEAMTFTCAPWGSGRRMGIDRNQDDVLDADDSP